MRERPILFKGELAHAILEGRKTMTRRLVNGLALDWLNDGFTPEFVALTENSMCPYGVPGDRLWVRETFAVAREPEEGDYGLCHYRADNNPRFHVHLVPDGGWRPSIFMPRWASRITLEIVSVKVERLNDITEEDALREGITLPPLYADEPLPSIGIGVRLFASLWDSINGKTPGASWEANPWVWVIEFKRVKP